MSKTTITAFLDAYAAPVVVGLLIALTFIFAHALYQVHDANMAKYERETNPTSIVELSNGCALYNDVVYCMNTK